VGYDKSEYIVIYDNRYLVRMQAWLSIGQTFLVILVLAIGVLSLMKITNDLVITPIESMMDKVKRIQENPLKAQQEEENEQLALEDQEQREGKQKN
jgi:F0F1-type ATP synthase membrane subunit b/b'